MLFNSFEFAVFFVAVICAYWGLLCPYRRARLAFLVAASYYFYMCWNWKFAGLILFSTVLDFVAGRRIHASASPRVRRAWLVTSLVGNLGCLGIFKYFNFFAGSIKAISDAAGVVLPVGHWEVILPVGISFYTFQSLSYTIDIYRGALEPTSRFLDFALFVSFFPQLVAGPIVRAKDFLPQLERRPHFDDRAAQDGIARILSGLFKKICIADALAVSLNDFAFQDPSRFGGLTLLFAVYGYAMQIYCDFSGYSDIAIGAAQVLGFRLPPNFNRPYLAASVTEFWRRWHLSLSSWLRDYLYIPLGGNRKGKRKTYRNVLITMLLGGLWHGAAWNFVIWGGLHGIFLVIERLRSRPGLARGEVPSHFGRRILRRMVTFHLVCLSWILFRAPSAESGFLMLKRILTLADGASGFSSPFLAALTVGYALHFSPPWLKEWLHRRYVRLPAWVQAPIVAGGLLLFMSLAIDNAPFIYFQF